MARKRESVETVQKRLTSMGKTTKALKRLEKAQARIAPFAVPRTYIATKASETWMSNPGASSTQYPSEAHGAHKAEIDKAGEPSSTREAGTEEIDEIAPILIERHRQSLSELAEL